MRLYAALPPKPTEAEAELLAYERAEQVAEYHALCEHALAELITTGTSLAKAVATRLEFDVARDIADRYGSAGFKGGQPAGKGFALASQAVRKSVLLLKLVLQDGWWEAVDAETPRRPAERRAPAGDGKGAGDAESVDKVDRLDQLDRLETVADDVGQGWMAGAVEALRGDMAKAAATDPDLAEAEPLHAAKPPCFEAASPDRPWQDPPD